MPPQDKTDQQMSAKELAGRLKQLKPALNKYTDESIVDAFLDQNPKFRARVRMDFPPPTLEVPATKISPRGFKEKAKEAVAAGKEVLPAVGAVGATALLPEGAPLWQILAAAGIGGATGRAGAQLTGHAIGEADPGIKARLAEMGTEGLRQVLNEMLGRSAEFPVRKIFGQGSRQAMTAEDLQRLGITPEEAERRGLLRRTFGAQVGKPEDVQVGEISRKYGLNLTPTEIEKRGIQESVQRSAEGSILGRATMQNVKERTFQAAEKAANDALAQLSAPSSSLRAGASLQTALKDANEIFHQTGRRLYEDVDRLGGNVLVNLQPLKDFANSRLQGPAGQAAATFEKMAKFTTAEKAILQDASNSPQFVTFSVAHELRKRLLAVGPELTETMPSIGKGMAKKAAGIVTEQMERAGSGLQGAQAVNAWNLARSFWRDGAQVFGDGLIQKLIDEQPSLVVRAIKTPEDVETIRKALQGYSQRFGRASQRRFAGGAWNRFRERYTREILLKSPTGTQIEREPLMNLAENLKKTPPETLRALFSDPQGGTAYTVLRELAQAMERVNRMPEAPVMSFWRMLHFGGLEEYEYVVAKSLQNPRLARRLLYGVRQLPRSFDTFARVMGQLQDETERPEPGATTGRPLPGSRSEVTSGQQ